MSPQQDALFQAILDDPDDDAVRLVLADWCEENGQADRAEFIRLQMRRVAGRPFAGSSDPKPSAREHALLEQHAGEWFDPPAGWTAGTHYEVRRGFPFAIRCNSQECRKYQGALGRWPITRFSPSEPEPEYATLLAEGSWPWRIRELDLYTRLVGPEGLRLLAESPALVGLQWLNVGCCSLHDEGATFLARQPLLPHLRHIDLRDNGITRMGLRALIGSEHRGAVESLVLCANNVKADDACALLASERWASLTELDLWNTRLGDAGVARLAECPALSRLTALGLNYNRITDAGVRVLASSPHARNLRILSLASNALSSASADVLIDSPHLRGLMVLRLTNNTRIHWRKRKKLEEHFGPGVRFDQM